MLDEHGFARTGLAVRRFPSGTRSAQPGSRRSALETSLPGLSPLSEDTQARLPVIFGGLSVALGRTITIIDPDLKRVHAAEWERAFRVFDLLI